MFDLFMFAILYILPMTLIFYTYRRVIKVLWNIDMRLVCDETPRTRTASNSIASAGNNINNIIITNNARRSITTYSFTKRENGYAKINLEGITNKKQLINKENFELI